MEIEEGISLLEGPPGTGKAYTIVSLISFLEFCAGNDLPKILICAPSNVAIEQLVSKIYENGLINQYGISTWAFKLVKISCQKSIKKNKLNWSSIADISYELEDLTWQNFEKVLNEEINKNEIKLETLNKSDEISDSKIKLIQYINSLKKALKEYERGNPEPESRNLLEILILKKMQI